MDDKSGAATSVDSASEELRGNTSAETKVCIGCGITIVRAANVRNWNWGKRRFCTRQCGAIAAARDPVWRERLSAALRTKYGPDAVSALSRLAPAGNARPLRSDARAVRCR
jgi:hypothetical protein